MTNGYFVHTLKFIQEEGQWVGDCEELGVAHYGETLDKVRAGLEELLALTLNSMESVGEQKRFLAKHDIKLHPYDAGSRVS